MEIEIKHTLTINEIIAIAISLIALWFTWKQYYLSLKSMREEKKRQRILENNLETSLFTSDDIIKSTHCYIEPNYSSVNPGNYLEIRNLMTAEENIFDAIDRYLSKEIPKNNPYHHILILADSGMGKTSFVLNYYAKNKKKRCNQHKIYVVPLGQPKAIVDDFIVKEIPNKKDAIIFLDAFDEDKEAAKDYRKRIDELMEMCLLFKRVIITSRTQFFPSADETPIETNILKVGSRPLDVDASYTFMPMYISPLSDKQVDTYLKKFYPWRIQKRKKASELIQKIPNLKVRPMLLTYIPDIIDNMDALKVKYSFQLYDILIDKWYKREEKKTKKPIQPIKSDDLRNFSEKLSIDLYENSSKRGTEKIPGEELTPLANSWNIPLENWQLRSRSLLNRDAEGNYKFSHRSIMEFLYVKKYKYHKDIQLTDQMKTFLREIIQDIEEKNEQLTIQQDVKKTELSSDQLIFRLKDEKSTIEKRIDAGNLLSTKFEDLRFLSEFWFLPDEHFFGFIEIPKGEFLMGSDSNKDESTAKDREAPQHSFFLDHYYISKYPVTVMQYKKFLQSKSIKVDSNWPACNNYGNHPVVMVKWAEAMEYCKWLTQKLRENKECVNKFSTFLKTDNWQVILPSEAEWEKAARGEDGRIYPWGNKFDSDRLNYYGSNIKSTSPVGCFEKGASPYKVSEMCGNVREWTRSIWGNKPGKPEFTYPYKKDKREKLSDTEDILRVCRGGYWRSQAKDCRIASRDKAEANKKSNNIGFRLCLTKKC